jgi:hypothetical protein
MANDHREPSSTQPEYQNPAGCLTRIFWMGIGNCALLLAAVSVQQSAGWSIADVAFWLIVGLLIGARYIDIGRYKGTTIDGDPATTAHFKRYAPIVLLAGTAVWVIARALGPGFD